MLYAGQVIAQDLHDEHEFFDTPEGPETMDNSFMGYSIAVGHFNNDSVPGISVILRLHDQAGLTSWLNELAMC